MSYTKRLFGSVEVMSFVSSGMPVVTMTWGHYQDETNQVYHMFSTHLKPAQARELAQELIKAADAVELPVISPRRVPVTPVLEIQPIPVPTPDDIPF